VAKRQGQQRQQRHEPRGGSAERRWVYAYQIEPPESHMRFTKIKALLASAHTAAHRAARMFTGRIVVEMRVSQILIVSDSPSRQRAINRALETELKRLRLRFLVNEPVDLSVARL
jgi:hypothetical protein